METKIFPLGKVIPILQAMETDVSYAYEDLVFPLHNAFIIQFHPKNENTIFVHFNNDCYQKDISDLYTLLEKFASIEKMTLLKGKKYILKSNEKTEEINIEFLDVPSLF